MTKLITTLIVFIIIMVLSDKATAQHYTDWTGFEFTRMSNVQDYYELQKDYTVNLTEYFQDKKKLPVGAKFLVDKMRNWAKSRPPGEWDFIRLEIGGILTVKKGYRWDGPSYPWREHSDHNYRSSLVHDALYDLMRMGYLEADHFDFGDPLVTDNAGDYNRKMADLIHYMIAVEDGQSKSGAQGAYVDYKVLRLGGGAGTHNNNKLKMWKYHVSELTAYASDSVIELSWKRANDAGKDPKYSEHFSPPFQYDIVRDGQIIATVDAYEEVFPNPHIFTESYIDSNVVNGTAYEYQILPHADNNNQHDFSHIDIAVPMKGPGNALFLDGINDYVKANPVANDIAYQTILYPLYPLTLEAWVHPQQQDIQAVIMAFNSISGGNIILLTYNSSTQKFYYYDDMNNYIGSDSLFPPGNWYHVAVTIDERNQGALYVNGIQQAQFNAVLRPKHGAQFSIGQEWDGLVTSQHFKGLLDEIRIWKIARTDIEIQDNMNNPLVGNEPALVGLWHFDEPTDYMLAWESTVNDNNGILTGYYNGETTFVPSCAMSADCTNDYDDDTTYVEMYIDIKPGSCPNPLNLKTNNGKSVLPVAVLGTEDFDLHDIDPSTITLLGQSPVRWSYDDVGTPYDNDDCECSEEGPDGFIDLTLKFDRNALIDTMLKLPYEDMMALTVTGMLNDGTEFKGTDCVRMLKNGSMSEAVELDGDIIPREIILVGNNPNPFNPTTTISYGVPSKQYIKIEIFNMLGQRVTTLVNKTIPAGYHTVEWDASALASGVYLYRLVTVETVKTKKMVLLK